MLLAAIAVCMIAGYIVSNQLEWKRVRSILEKEKAGGAVLLNRAIGFNSKSLNNFVYDYTYWDDMVRFVMDKDLVWADEMINTSLSTFDIDYAWVYSTDLSLVYSTNSEAFPPLTNIPMTFQDLKAVTSGPALNYFYIKSGNDIIQISEGSIHPTDDPERATPPSGFFLVGRVWTENYLDTIGMLTGTELTLQKDNIEVIPKDSIGLPDFKVINFTQLRGIDNKAKAIVKSTGVVGIARDFQKDAKSRLKFLALALIIILLIVSVTLIGLINRPLRILVSSLSNEDPDQIAELLTRKTEFGKIAQMISDFFVQKKKLVDEIDERIKIQTELIQAKEKAEESDRLKTSFLNNISHEIRTPINAIVGFSDLINDTRLDETERMEFTSIIVESSYRLMGVITDLINLSTVESGQEALKVEQFSLNLFMQEIYAQIKPSVDLTKVKFTVDLALTDVHSQVIADKTKLHQIIMNLLKNSLKFTSRGRIEYGYVIRNADIEFFIRDTGIGIPKDKSEVIFARFQQADDSLSRQYGGAGLGLPIAKAYVDLMGGQMWFNSEVGKGTEFFFTIPFNTPRSSQVN